MVPVVTRESDIPVGDYGLVLDNDEIDTIRDCVLSLSCISGKEMEIRSRKTWENSLNYCPEKFSECFKASVIKTIDL